MARLRAGKAEAFATLYQRSRAIVFTFLLGLTRDRVLAEDLLQESFTRATPSRRPARP